MHHASNASCASKQQGWSSGPIKKKVEYVGALGWRTSDGQGLKMPTSLAVAMQAALYEYC